jgi:hypothetical protein
MRPSEARIICFLFMAWLILLFKVLELRPGEVVLPLVNPGYD